jgi:hypothetical protein
MAQFFHPSTNTVARVSVFGAVVILAALGCGLAVFYRSSYVTEVGIALA